MCLRSDQPMTREHVFARWLVRQVHGGQLVASDALRDQTSPRAPLRIARVTAEVCAECNAGWMSSLERSFRRAVFARPRVGTIPAPDRVMMSRWFAKTAVLLAHARGRAFVTAAQRLQLVGGMPEDVEVFLGRRRRAHQDLDFRFDAPTDDDRVALRSVAIAVDDLVAHVAARGRLLSRHGTRLWPLRTHTMRWDTLPIVSGS